MFKVRKGFTVIEIAIVIAIVAILAGVWYVSKNKAGADIKMPGIENTGTTTTVGNTTPPKMGMGRIKGQVTYKNGSVAANARVNSYRGKCSEEGKSGSSDYYGAKADSKGYYSVIAIPPGSYCIWAYPSQVSEDKNATISIEKDINVTFDGTTTADFKLGVWNKFL